MPVVVLKAGSNLSPISLAMYNSSSLYHAMPVPAFLSTSAATWAPSKPLKMFQWIVTCK